MPVDIYEESIMPVFPASISPIQLLEGALKKLPESLDPYFRRDALNDLIGEEHRIVLMRPADFLAMAAPVPARGLESSEDEIWEAVGAGDDGRKLESLPTLTLAFTPRRDIELGHELDLEARVIDQDGRLRASVLSDAGAELIPVALLVDPEASPAPGGIDQLLQQTAFIYPGQYDEDEVYDADPEGYERRQKPMQQQDIYRMSYGAEQARRLLGLPPAEPQASFSGIDPDEAGENPAP